LRHKKEKHEKELGSAPLQDDGTPVLMILLKVSYFMLTLPIAMGILHLIGF
jgi:hypothetical protein